jgi:diguanylate cyclase (GGDEF)-like protein/PAS domain S-box-containing protein
LKAVRKKNKQQIIAEALNFQVAGSILDHVSDLVWIKDIRGRYIAVSKSFNKLFDLESETMIGKTDDNFSVGCLTGTDDDRYVIQNSTATVSQKSLPLANGETKFFEVRKSPIYDLQGMVSGIVAIGRDVTATVRSQEYFCYLSYHDTLTKAHNRNYFEQLPEKLSKENIRTIGMIVCDIDGLKLVNDTLGHNAGDERLRTAAGILAQAAGDHGELARISGDEFIIVAPNASQNAIDEILHRMKTALDRYNKDCENLPLHISFGAATGNVSKTDFFTMFQEAGNSMYRDKMLHHESNRGTMVKTLIKMFSLKDYIMEGHADRLQQYVAVIGREIGLPESKVNDLRLLAEFHDIGKVGIPENILNKPGPLTAEEAEIMRRHPQIGFHIARSVPELIPIADCILKHHEWWNGAGYPLGLKGDDIPVEARIIHVADAFDAMTHNRPYRKALTSEVAISELQRGAGGQFDSYIVGKFVKIICAAGWRDKGQENSGGISCCNSRSSIHK